MHFAILFYIHLQLQFNFVEHLQDRLASFCSISPSLVTILIQFNCCKKATRHFREWSKHAAQYEFEEATVFLVSWSAVLPCKVQTEPKNRAVNLQKCKPFSVNMDHWKTGWMKYTKLIFHFYFLNYLRIYCHLRYVHLAKKDFLWFNDF